VSLGNIWKKKVMGGYALPGADIQKPLRQNVAKEKQKLTCFAIFYKNRRSPNYEFYSNLSFHTVFKKS
jgi:hypothetical protein